jgi:hypothetical protein
MGVAGGDDDLSALWGHGLHSSPAAPRPKFFDRLTEAIKSQNGAASSHDLIPGQGRLAIDFHAESPQRCRYAGECMSGCPYNAIYSAKQGMARLARHIDATVTGHVLAIQKDGRTMTVRRNGEQSTIGPFDRIFLAAGCIGSGLIAINSGLCPARLTIFDNYVANFLIAGTGRTGGAGNGAHLPLTSMVIACRPKDASMPSAVMQLYPWFDFLWKLTAPRPVWPVLERTGALLRKHMAIARLYLPGDVSQTYALEAAGDGSARLALRRKPKSLDEIPGLWASIRARVRGGGFRVLPKPVIYHQTSSHYSGGLELGRVADAGGRLAEGIYICDSAAFPHSSAFSPTLTIMAHAHRVAAMAIRPQGGQLGR